MRVLLSKPDALGDQFIAAGLVQALLARRPEIRVVWHVCATRECVASLLGAEVFVPDWANQPPNAEAARLAALPGRLILLPFPLHSHEVWSDDLRRRLRWWHAFLQASAWDASVLGLVNRNWVGDFTVLAAPAPRRLGFEALPMRQPLVNEAGSLAGADQPSFTQRLPASFERAEAAQLQDLFALLEPSLAGPAAPPVWSAVPPRPRPAPAREPRRIAFAPGVGGDPRRAWPLGHFLTLAAEWQARGAEVQWIEGPGDAPYFAGLPEAEFPQRRRFGVGDLAALADTVAAVDLLICHDTAYAHLAAGLGTPTVALFGGGQHRRFHPASARVKVVQGLPPCSGCQWHCLHDRLLCVADLPVAAVRAAVDALLAGDAGALEVPIRLPLPPEHLVRRLQEEVLQLNADRFARLQIIQSLLAPPAAVPPATPVQAPASAPAPATTPGPETVPSATPTALPTAPGASAAAAAGESAGQAPAPRPAGTREGTTAAEGLPAAPAPSAGAAATPPSGDATGNASPAVGPALTAATPTPGAPRLSVIIPMGRPERVAGTLRALLAQAPAAGLTWEVVLVGTEAAPVAAAHPRLPIVPVVLARREIPPKTRCLGVERARGDWFLFVDDDVELAPEVLLGCAARLDRDPHLGALGPRLPGKSPRFFGRVTDYANFWAQQDAVEEERDWLYSAAILVRAEAYRRSGGFDPDLPNGEDVDLTRRIRAAGYTLRYDPALVAFHDHGRDTFGAMCRYFWRNGNAARYFFGPHGGACCFSLRAALTRPWADWRMNAAFRARHGERLGWLTPWVLLAYLIVETSLEYHYQVHLAATQGYERLPARTRSDRVTVRAMRLRAAGHRGRGALLYAWAVLLDFATPSRR
jgi:ADP-heptose:LPS heptosyltransferase/glycosyltransferase involved in cell wall biosynthesis